MWKYLLAAFIGLIVGYLIGYLAMSCPGISIGTPPPEWNNDSASFTTTVDSDKSAKHISVVTTGTAYSISISSSSGTAVPPPTPRGGAQVYLLPKPTSGIETYTTTVSHSSASAGSTELTPRVYFDCTVEGTISKTYHFWDDAGSSLTITVVEETM